MLITSPPLDHDLAVAVRDLVDNVERVVTGKRAVVELAVVTVLAGGHLLLEDVPGVGKTLLARALARSIDGHVTRIQGAPDLLPADLTGSSVYDGDRRIFTFVPGPLFANVVLMDEVNRATPRTQAALLEAMEEGQVTVDGQTHALPVPHVVLATQNPLEQHGTFPLPESQIDRFTAATSMGYPAPGAEIAIVRDQVHHAPILDLEPVLTTSDLARLRDRVRDVVVSDEAIGYVVRLVRATREHPDVVLGASPRSAVQLVHASQARAALEGRGHVLPDDVKRLAPAVLAHRLIVARDAAGVVSDRRALVHGLLARTPVRA